MAVVGVLMTALPAYAAAPTISNLNPSSGAPGATVTITGTNFNNPNVSSVTFNGVSAAFTIVGATTISTTVPCNATDGNVQVTNGDGSATSPFDVLQAGAPTVSSFNPTSGVAGTTVVTITGTNFCGATQVRFNNTNATSVGLPTPTQITATVPTGATSGRISVTTASGTGTSATNFVIGLPVISSFSPTIGPVGSAVTISGSNFNGVTAVRFNNTNAVFTVVSETQISTTVPSGATTGPITVVNPLGTATGATFTVGVPSHSRTVTFQFANNNRVTGQVNVGDGFSPCRSNVPVVIQRRTGNGGWKWADRTATTGDGSYKTFIPPNSGTFRARVPQLQLMDGSTCEADVSPTRSR